MAFRKCLGPLVVGALVYCAMVWQGTFGCGGALAQEGGPAFRVADRSAVAVAKAALASPQPNEHPLMPTIRWAREGLRVAEQIKDYSATVVKRERIDGKVGDAEVMFVKIRQKPFSVYMQFLAPANVKGQEVIWVEGANNGKMWAHGSGFRKVFGTVELDPTGPIAMKGNRYPITEMGVTNLLRRLIEVGEKDTQYGECEVKFFPGAKINERSHTCVQVVHPQPRKSFLFHVARIFVDDEFNLPTRYESHDWPAREGEEAQLIEEYTYLNLKVDNGYTDADFDVRNPNYGFKSK